MKWADIVKIGRTQPVIETFMLAKNPEELPKVRVQLSRWVNAGRLIQVKKGAYVLSDDFAFRPTDWEHIATFVCRPSYISLHYALADYGMIPEHVPNITLVTTRRPKTIEQKNKRLIYKHVKTGLFWGYEMRGERDFPVFFAEPEKAVLDLFYFTSIKIDIAFIEEMRFQNTEILDEVKFMKYAERFESPKMIRAARLFLKFLEKGKNWETL